MTHSSERITERPPSRIPVDPDLPTPKPAAQRRERFPMVREEVSAPHSDKDPRRDEEG